MLRRRHDRRANYFYCAIDVAGFAAIMVALLGMFLGMAGGSIDHPRFSVNLPKVTNPTIQRKADREDAIHISVTHDGKLYFKGMQVPSLELPELISQSIREGAERKGYISADHRASYGSIVEVLDAVHEAGITDVAFMAEKRQ
jgi:biopolymer transport protein ExbD